MTKLGRPVSPLKPRNRLQRLKGAKSHSYWILLGDAYHSMMDKNHRKKWQDLDVSIRYKFPFWIKSDDCEGVEVSYPGIPRHRKKLFNSPYIFDRPKGPTQKLSPYVKGERDARTFAELAKTFVDQLLPQIEQGKLEAATVQDGAFVPIENQTEIFWRKNERKVFYSGRIRLPNHAKSSFLALNLAEFDLWREKVRQDRKCKQGHPYQYNPALDGVIEIVVRQICNHMPAVGANLTSKEWGMLINCVLANYDIQISDSALDKRISSHIISRIDRYRLAEARGSKDPASRVGVDEFMAKIGKLIEDKKIGLSAGARGADAAVSGKDPTIDASELSVI